MRDVRSNFWPRVFLRAAMTAASGILWILSWETNQFLFRALEVAPGINLIFFPHGFRVLLSLLFGFWGATGIALVSASASRDLWGDAPLTAFVLPLVSGYCGWIALKLVQRGNNPQDLQTSPVGNRSSQQNPKSVGPARMDSSSLIALVCLSAIINSGGHIGIYALTTSLDQHGNLHSIASGVDRLHPGNATHATPESGPDPALRASETGSSKPIGVKASFAQSFAAMLCGDLLGGLILLYSLRWFVLIAERLSKGIRRK
jgi:hypothetical protein